MIRILCILSFGFLYCTALAQNPFDIKSRKKTSSNTTEETKTTPTPATKKLPVQNQNPVVTSVDTKTDKELNPSSAKQVPKNYTKSSNPFDVSHIPLSGNMAKPMPIEKPFTPAPVPKQEVELTKTEAETPAAPLEITKKTKPNIRITQKKQFLERNLPFLLLFISLLILAFVVGFTKKTITNVIRSTYNENFMKLTNKQSNNGKSTAFLLLYSLFFINLALLIFLFVKDRSDLHSGLLFMYIFTALVLAYLIRHIFLFVMGSVFKDIKKEASQYSFTIEVFNICAGLALLPLNFFISFGSEKLAQFCLYLALAIFAIIFIIRTIRAILLSSRYLVRNKFHYFLYLCTCEIGPVFVLIKVLTDYL